ncbi:MAG: AAA family ATPase [Acidovorax sp.]|jgi:adenylate kinase family enzyme|nr:AAA family ATPase [Acidovorax sp.]
MRYIVIGTSGAGKSTFAQGLAQTLSCVHIELDTLYWGPHWQAVPTADFLAGIEQATRGPHWVADGNYSAARDLLWGRGTHIIWLNYGRATVFTRVLWRTLSRALRRTPLFHGNRESLHNAFFSRDSILLWSLTSFSRNREKYTLLRQGPEYAHLQWTEFTHPRQAAAWLAARKSAA